MLEAHILRWNLSADGLPFATYTSRLLSVLRDGVPAMLKLATIEDESRGGRLLEWWDGVGAARVMAREGDAILMERATGTTCLGRMAREGADEEACRVLCHVAAGLHRGRPESMPWLVPLEAWFEPLHVTARARGGLLSRCSSVARALVAEGRDVTVLHGDLHHGNVLDFGPRGWLAIDPKGLVGDRAFDHAPMFLFPDLLDEGCGVARDPTRFGARVAATCAASGLGRDRLLSWILAWAGLSASWWIADGRPADVQMAVAGMAAAALDG